MATGIGKPEDLALAGLFHDVALVDFPYEGEDFSPEEMAGWSDQVRKQYLEHPLHSTRVLKGRRMTIPAEISNIIEQHHERADGRGFPKQLPSFKIRPEAGLLHLADQVEILRQPRQGKRRYSLEGALDAIEKSQAISPEVIWKVKKAVVRGKGS